MREDARCVCGARPDIIPKGESEGGAATKLIPMNLNDLLVAKKIDPEQVLVLRHRPPEPHLNRVLSWLAAEKPKVFNAYQQTQQNITVERAFLGAKYVASFIGHKPGKALFVGLYAVGGSKPLTREEFWLVPEYVEMKAFGMEGFAEGKARSSVLWFELELMTEFHAAWKGKLVVRWPPQEINWFRRAHKNEMPVLAILEDSALDSLMPPWDQLKLTWGDLRVLPLPWRAALSEWRGIYYIFDVSDGKGYVGSACGERNLLGRWEDYAKASDGGNVLLRKRDSSHLRFSILQRVSPDMDPSDVIGLEGTWKERLHTRQPHGLNAN